MLSKFIQFVAGFLVCAACVPVSLAQQSLAQQAPSRPTLKLALVEGMSGAFANAGESVARNVQFAVDRVNTRFANAPAMPRLELLRFDSKGQVEEANILLRAAIDQGARVILQGNSSAVAASLIESIEKHNQRDTARQVVFLNFSAVDPTLTNERCSFWHFRFDAHADMRLSALTDALAQNRRIKKVYLLNQDYSFGQRFAKSAKQMILQKRSDIEVVGDELHPLGRVRDFAPYMLRVKQSGADTVVTGNWGNDLSLMVRAGKDIGLDANYYTFYANGLGAPQAIGSAGVGKVRAVAEWHPNAGMDSAEQIYLAFKKTLKDNRDDYFNIRHVVMLDMLGNAIKAASDANPSATVIARGLSGMLHRASPYVVMMRKDDHQLLTPMYVSVMEEVKNDGKIKFDLEASGFGFRTERYVEMQESALPHSCKMERF